ncbi:MAG TPA: efflux RND transporter periplasmic adaptor subunit [Burkholderiaceae bacterium]|nr:efflux RND transporter periplasmic adaptor subunit [Burkholderiaceae bacterium]
MANRESTPSLGTQRPSLWRRLLLTVVLVVVLIGAIVGVKVFLVMRQIASIRPPAPPTVTTTQAQMQDWRNQIDTVGSLRAWRGTDLSTEVAGLVRAIRFRSGQSVAAGDVLVELNADAEKAQLLSMEAAADLARTTLVRDRGQLAAQAVAQATIDADEADLKSKTAQVEQQRAVVEKKTIRAPFAGRTGITTVNPGQYLNAGDKVVTLQSIDTLYLDFNVPQRELSRVRAGAAVDAHVDAWPQQTYSGKVSAINPAADTGTRNVQVEATMKNPKHELLPGMFARVELLIGSRERHITVPQAAVAFNPYGATVFVVESGKNDKGETTLTAKQTFVTTGPTRGDQVAILSGLKEGDVVVTSGQLKLKTGSFLRVDNSVLPRNDASPAPQEH